ncbi:AraC family transcriptional regulator [Epilithonimonas vandammei]|uniref:AraC family transcriptional regulator n=1 Tax=Epilithonimonas vandammei TaxID=2487072 RepID=A0A3G8ZFH8_9FLAO|nr:AraC family transcriptional regulator [Epilithonimonas vandammei]
MVMNKGFLALFLFFFVHILSQKTKTGFEEIRSRYENLRKNDLNALPDVREYIKKAKRESVAEQLVQGYRDAVFFSPKEYDKLIYSDSMIYVAFRSRDNDLISLAYLGKGIIYYFNFKKFKPALDEYLKAFEYSKNTKDEYLRHKVIYHMAVVKSYLGYYKDAAEQFQQCLTFFEGQSNQELHPNEIFNNTRGYFNSLHQMVVCQRNLKNFSAADSLVNIGLSKLATMDDFALERSYLLKCKGISNYYNQNYEGAIPLLRQSLPQLIKADDFYWTSVVYFYLGKSLYDTNKEEALSNFEKVDSIFSEHHFIVPEVRENYELLIKHYRKNRNLNKELYYTDQLLAVDSLINKDFTFLSSRIHGEYDTKSLLEKKEYLEKTSSRTLYLVILLLFLSILFLFLYVRHRKNEKLILAKYKILQQKLNTQTENRHDVILVETRSSNIKSHDLSEEILQNLAEFEENKEFTKAGLSMSDLAERIGTNTTYLSTYFNDTKGMSFKHYLNTLRINYITHLLNNDKKYLYYTIQALADKCGISTRQSFTTLFYEVNGIRPKDFIRKRLEELQEKKEIQ